MQNYNIDEKFKNIISPEKFASLLENIKIISYRNTVKFQERFPDASADDGIYSYNSNFYDSWHGGWWTGIYYMAYLAFGDERYRHYAENISGKLYTLIKNNRIFHYEMGFEYLPVCIHDIRLSKNSEAAEACILAAEYMMESFNNIGNSESGNEKIKHRVYGNRRYRAASIVNSCIFNVAARINGNSKFIEIGNRFVNDCIKYNIDPDGRCYMNVRVCDETGEIVYNVDDSAQYGFTEHGDYIRPYAWISMGLCLRYLSEKDEKYENKLYEVLNRFLNVSGGGLSCFVPGDPKGRNITDSTSLAIFVRTLAELLKNMNQSHIHYDFYFKQFKKSFNEMISYAMSVKSGMQGFLDKGIFLGGYDLDGRKIKNSCNICGDYFYFESLMLMTKEYKSCWNAEGLFD